MKTRHTWIFGLAALGLTTAAPVQASPDFRDGSFLVAKRDQADETRQDQRDSRKDGRRPSKREAEREESRGYGYGYERRQQQQPEEEDSRPRGRR